MANQSLGEVAADHCRTKQTQNPTGDHTRARSKSRGGHGLQVGMVTGADNAVPISQLSRPTLSGRPRIPSTLTSYGRRRRSAIT
jgi:hypothetical protein